MYPSRFLEGLPRQRAHQQGPTATAHPWRAERSDNTCREGSRNEPWPRPSPTDGRPSRRPRGGSMPTEMRRHAPRGEVLRHHSAILSSRHTIHVRSLRNNTSLLRETEPCQIRGEDRHRESSDTQRDPKSFENCGHAREQSTIKRQLHRCTHNAEQEPCRKNHTASQDASVNPNMIANARGASSDTTTTTDREPGQTHTSKRTSEHRKQKSHPDIRTHRTPIRPKNTAKSKSNLQF